MKFETIKVAMKNSIQAVWEKDEWDDYFYDGKFFIIKKNGSQVGFYNLNEVVSIIIQ